MRRQQPRLVRRDQKRSRNSNQLQNTSGFDHRSGATMWEPRGHADMDAAVITASRDADLDVFLLHNDGYSTVCGHAIIATMTLAFETGLVARTGDRRELTINVPAGRIHAPAHMDGDRVNCVSFRNVPSFVYRHDQHIHVPSIGSVRFDIAYGGAFYALVEAPPLEPTLVLSELNRLIDLGRRLEHAVMATTPIAHPFESDLSFSYGTIFTGPALSWRRPQEQPGTRSSVTI
ncbi:proline racemase family protein [Peristeroidobacter soli]|uniref:proline racemase family protein n=1 Tax=Peristeroidobacter soli TaxID=2497877 RepID=UPI002482F6DA|nr:proline racemase family protein [Peristeroidobacter soli]